MRRTILAFASLVLLSHTGFAQTGDKKVEIGIYGSIPFGLQGATAIAGNVTNTTDKPLAAGGGDVAVSIKSWLRGYGDIAYISLGRTGWGNCQLVAHRNCILNVTASGSAVTFHAGIELQARRGSKVVPFGSVGLGFVDEHAQTYTEIFIQPTNTVERTLVKAEKMHLSGQLGAGLRVYVTQRFGVKASVVGNLFDKSGGQASTFGMGKAGVFFVVRAR